MIICDDLRSFDGRRVINCDSMIIVQIFQVGGMLPPKEGDTLLVQSPVYAQIFLSHNGQ